MESPRNNTNIELKDIKQPTLKRDFNTNGEIKLAIHEDDLDNSFSEQMKDEIKAIYWDRIKKDITNSLDWREKWLKINRYSETIATILLVASGLSASLQLVNNSPYWSVAVIITNSVIFSLFKLSTNAKENNTKLNDIINNYFRTIHFKKVVPSNV